MSKPTHHKEVFAYAYARAGYHTLLSEGKEDAQRLGEALEHFLVPLLQQLDAQIDKRLVRTFFCTLVAIVQFRNRACGLLLSEPGGYILSPHQAPAGTKRLSNLLRSTKWHHSLIEQFTWNQTDARVDKLLEQGEDVLCVWDESEWEKSDSIELQGLCSVRSAKADRLKRHKKGYHQPPPTATRTTCVRTWYALAVNVGS